MRLLFQLVSLSDRYERKARLLPGLVAASPVALTVAAISAVQAHWYVALGTTAGVELLVAFLLGHLARARGKAIEQRMWREWGGAPTTRWLRPADETCSAQQKSRWRGAIKRATGLTIPASTTADVTEADIDLVINDATRQLRYALRDRPEAAMVRIHNEDYGFARSLLALRWHWAGLAALSLVACCALLIRGEDAWLGLGVAGGSLMLALFVGRELPRYIRLCAERYAESLFAAAILYDRADRDVVASP
jgi:hypothetical protein